MKLTIGIAQIPGHRDPDKNLEKIDYYSSTASKSNIDLIVFPEMAMGVIDKQNTPYSLSKHHEKFLSKVTLCCVQNQIDIISTVWEPCRTGQKTYNSAVFVSRKGDITTLYRKLHLFDSMGFRESSLVLAGDKLPPIIDYRGINISVSICYDLRFPELYRYQAINNTDISIVCSAWYMGKLKEEHLLTLLKARAIENTMYVACANLCGEDFSARSSVFDPYGILICDAGEEEGLISCEIKKERIQNIRKRLGCLEHIRRDIFP